MKKENFTNITFNRWTTIKELPETIFLHKDKEIKKRKFLCQCKCGNFKEVFLDNLKKGVSKSCGCLVKENSGIRTHGMSKTSEYHIWNSIKERCYNVKNHAYNYYGGKGIKMYSDWIKDFKKFYDYIGKRPSKHHSIDRIDSNGNYEPNNIRWATHKEQSRNLSSNINITINSETKCVNEWCEFFNIKRETVKSRISYGWSLEDAVSIPVRKNQNRKQKDLLTFSDSFLSALEIELKNLKLKSFENFIIEEKLRDLVKSKLLKIM